MCLNVTDTKVKTAERDIVCYKLLKARNDLISSNNNRNVFYSEYQNFIYDIGKTYKLKSPLTCLLSYNPFYLGEVHRGFHSFSRFEDVICYQKNVKVFYHGIFEKEGLEFVLARCVIPRGSKYFEGSYFNNLGSGCCYASSAIKVLEIIEEK